MMNKTLIILLVAFTSATSFSQTTVTARITELNPNHNYILTNGLFDAAIPSPMTYESSNVSSKGAAFEVVYHNSDGDSKFDGYLSGTVGGYKESGTYHPGIFSACGMPTQIQDIGDDFRIKWDPYQLGVDGQNDKWWASINVVFDGGAPDLAPVEADRDYDLVIEFDRYEEYIFEDKPKKTTPGQGGSYQYLCRDGFVDDGDGNNIAPIHPFEVVLEGITYQFAVRYKFFNYPPGSSQIKLNKNNKVHIKFIPLDTNVMPFLDHPLKSFIEATKTYYNLYLDGLPTEEKNLADQKVGLDALWVKNISAGYEVYKDAGDNNGNDPNNGITLGQHFFLTTTDNNPPATVTNLTISGDLTNPNLTWDATTDAESINTSIAEYKLYRSTNGGAYTLLTDKIYQENFTDNTTQSGSEYAYYVTAIDRSFNESIQSNIVSTIVLNINNTNVETFSVYPNPMGNVLYFKGNTANIFPIELYSILGEKQTINFDRSSQSLNIAFLKNGVYFLKAKNQTIKLLKFRN